MKVDYIGNGAYCYANSTSMLLSSTGENVSPSKIEVLTGVGLSASLSKEGGFLFFNNQNLLPDLGITKALNILGFDCKTRISNKDSDIPFIQLEKDLKISPAVLGPLDMGYLVYNPRYSYLKGADHFILVYKMDKEVVYLHDPAGYPYVSLELSKLKKSWKANSIFYRKGYYRYITLPRRVKNPTEKEIYNNSLEFFKEIYQAGEKCRNKLFIGSEAIEITANHIESNKISGDEWSHFVYFALPLGAKRALDFALFFNFFDKDLGTLKHRQAKLFGISHTRAMNKDWFELTKSLKELAEVEDKFKSLLLRK